MTTPNPRKPSSGGSQPSGVPKNPTPEDPREQEPMRDPPIYPEHDDGEGEGREAGGIEAPDPAPDSVVSDANSR